MDSQSTGSLFSTVEMKGHINVLELKTVLFGLKALTIGLTKVRIKVLTDNSTAAACINNFDTSRSRERDSAKIEIWLWASNSAIWFSVKHLTEMQNTEADFESRNHEMHTEWKSNESSFRFLFGESGFSSTIDLFATRINKQLGTSISYRPGPNCVAVNAFLINWAKEKLYAFLPFACLSKTLQNPRLAITTILPKVHRNVFTNYFCSSQENKLVSTKPTFNTSPTSQKTVTASLLCRWGNDALTNDVGKFIINSWVEKTKKQYRTYFDQ